MKLLRSGTWAKRPVAPLFVLVIGAAVAPQASAQVRAGTYYDFELFGTQHAEGATAQVKLRLAPSPFEMPVTVDGHVVFDVRVSARGLRDPGTSVYVVWAAPPTLDRTHRIGPLGSDLTVEGRVHFNKFLIFITRSANPETTEPLRDPIVLRGSSRSGRMRSIFDHTDIVGEP